MSTTRRSLVAALLSFVAIGCGDDGPVKYEVTGIASFQGKPIEKGEIRFLPLDGKGTVGSAPITDGEFELMSEPGTKRVEIRAAVKSKRQMKGPPGMTMPVMMDEMLPPKYHRESTLQKDVTPDGDNHFEFELN